MTGLAFSKINLRYSNSGKDAGFDLFRKSSGFTLIEIIIVVVILSIAALAAIPLMSSAAGVQIRSATNLIAADLEYAKSMAISRGQYFYVVFNEGTNSYQIEDQNNNIIQHPVKKGFPYVMNFTEEKRLNKVDITGVSFTDDKVRFDCLGSPDNGGTITLESDGTTATITMEPITGYISISL
ncbi:MAG: GspH/FimT family pseudopilin [Sedimentisphaerales bacterium]|nr:GspH/FimT family pseudopilin [Sedimentisphaerales bacterium]